MPSARQKEQANTTNTRPRSSIDNTSRLAKDRIQNQNTEGYSDSADEVTEDSIGRDTMLDHGANERSRRSRDKFKKHGSVTQSLALRRNERASSHSRVSESHTETTKTTKKKAKQAKVVHLDLYIPSIVTVGNLARLLNVRMGTYSMGIGCGYNSLFRRYRIITEVHGQEWHGRPIFL